MENIFERYQSLYDSLVINPDKEKEILYYVNKIRHLQEIYKNVETLTDTPWDVIGIIHGLESAFNFESHLHNGDPLTARTVQVPKGRPLDGNPPFSWQESAVDAINIKRRVRQGFPMPSLWLPQHKLYFLEHWNGRGYAIMGRASPYLWSYTQWYTKGKYASDGKYDPELVSKQSGAAPILKMMEKS